MERAVGYTASETTPAQWDILVRTFPDHTLFHRREWLELVGEVHGARVHAVKVDHGGRCIAVWPCLALRKGPFRILASPLPGWSSIYMGPLFTPGADTRAALEAFLRKPPLARWSYFRLRVLDEHRPVDLAPLGFTRLYRDTTYRLDLRRTEEALWKNLKSECRTRIRKAEKLGIEVRVEQGDDYIDDFWKMSEDVFSRGGIEPTFTLRFAKRLHERLAPNGLLRVLSAFHGGRRIATLVLPHDDHTMYYWAGGSFAEFRNLPAHNLLHWTAILDARREGLRTYDFVGSKGGPGRFKSTFGPVEHTVSTHWEASRSKVVGLLKDKYEQYLRWRRHTDRRLLP
jgi:CelD/BcsL family acetyltransferase involved in cellulose biosynthesis